MAGMDDAAENARIAGDLIRLGVITQVDLAAARCRVAITDDLVTGPIPWLAPAGELAVWAPPSVGEQVLVLCPDGDIAAGVAVRGIFSDAFPAPAAAGVFHAKMKDGSVISYDPAAHALKAILVAAGVAEIVAPGGITLTGKVTINGDVTVAGVVTTSGDVKAGSISLQNHKHGGVQRAGGISDGPQ